MESLSGSVKIKLNKREDRIVNSIHFVFSIRLSLKLGATPCKLSMHFLVRNRTEKFNKMPLVFADAKKREKKNTSLKSLANGRSDCNFAHPSRRRP